MFIFIERIALSVLLCSITLGCQARTVTLSAPFDLCAKTIKGVTFNLNSGIDADVIHAHSQEAIATIYIGQHPDIPPGMNIRRDKTRYVPRELGLRLQFIAESTRANGHGLVRLYGYDRAAGDQILILVSADDGRSNAHLVRQVGDALMRCKSK
ncbi:hypothetical protein QMK61_07205 [Fulvimonas sp. R45]|uniref:hypothetical protein n=1 Tax=Fulvimonas sp. R45 TaxID=3045937 RepID=UPI00265D8EAE|nr:hypothetical protein [Fulvimonas sp. R45]MDO1528624.1 hypothetical protein [Fulvimonas sp. R45]